MLEGSLPDAGYHGTENKNNKKENWENKTDYRILPMLFLSLENSEIPELWDLFHLWHSAYLA